MKPTTVALLTFISFSSRALADVVTLKNGDRISGALVAVKSGSLELKSEVLGDLKMPMAQVTSFSVAKPAVVIVKAQAPVQGQLELDPSGGWKVTSNGKSQTIAAANADLIMPAESYRSLVEHHAKPWQNWSGNASLGYGLQEGNQHTRTYSANINAVRERPETPIFTPHWRTNFDLATLLSDSTDVGTFIDSHTLTTSVRPQYLLTPANFIFGLVQFDHISTQGLYLRQTYGGGFGRDVVKTSRTTFGLVGGLTYAHEKFMTGAFATGAEVLVGEKLGHQFSDRVRLDHEFNFYPDLSDTGQYRFDTATTFSARLNGKFSLNTGVIDLYLSNPPRRDRKNSVTVVTGIRYTF